jgi:hypothetical protein
MPLVKNRVVKNPSAANLNKNSTALPATAPNHATQAPATSLEQADPTPTSGRPSSVAKPGFWA